MGVHSDKLSPLAQRPKGRSFKTIITQTQVLFHAERDTETKSPTRCKDFKSQKRICLVSWIKMFMFLTVFQQEVHLVSAAYMLSKQHSDDSP